MSSINERPEFYKRIDAALEHRHKLASAVEGLTKEMQSRFVSSDVRNLISVLRGSVTTEEIIHDNSKAMWLPVILRGVASETPADFSQIMLDVTFATENQKSRQRIFAYPLVLFCAALLLLVFLAKAVIPTFQEMFRDFQLRLPAATKLVFSISDQLNNQTVVFCLFLVGIFMAGWWMRRFLHWCLRHLETTWFLGSFTAGNSESVKAMARFTSTLAELLGIGSPLNEAVLIAGKASQNLRFRIVSETLSRDIGLSGKFNYKSNVAHNIPALVTHALEAGPNGVPSVPLLRQVSAVYFDRVRHRISWASGIYAPLWIIVVGFFVGFVVISIFMPLVSLITSLSG